MKEIRKILSSPLAIILLLSPLFLYALILLLPTFDDWTYFTTPYYDFGDSFANKLLPLFSYWRPFDAMFGYILSLKPSLFPALNHIAVYSGHLVNTFIIYAIAKNLNMNVTARNIAAIFFFLSPGMLGTVLGIDSLNQTYSQMWGLVALYFYLSRQGKQKYILWLSCTMLSVFSKENGIVFFALPQIIAFAFDRTTIREIIKEWIYAAIVIAIYFAIRYSLSNDDVYINPEYFENTVYRKLKNIGVFLGMTWLAIDYVSLVHAPNRNILIVAITFILSTPFMAYLFCKNRNIVKTKPFILLSLCVLIAASVHLVTLFTAMHPYAGMGMAALLVAYLADKINNRRLLKTLFAAYVVSCAFIDWHHWQKSYESGLTGKKMGEEAIMKTGEPVDKVYSITIIDGTPKYSSFCVIPGDAFAWGSSAYAATGYKWPKEVLDTALNIENIKSVDFLADKAIKEGYERVWLVHGDTVDVIR